MRIKKLTNSDVLKPGQLLVVSHCLNQCGFDPLGGLRKSIGAGVVQFYRHRREPVPWSGRSKNGRLFRRPRTTNERRALFSNEATEEILKSRGLAFKLRQERNSNRLPNAHDDLSLRYQRSWKEHRGASMTPEQFLYVSVGFEALKKAPNALPERSGHCCCFLYEFQNSHR
jgi:hypothetical protein